MAKNKNFPFGVLLLCKMATSFVKYPSTFCTITTYEVAHEGYTYHLKTAKSGAKYYYCDSRNLVVEFRDLKVRGCYFHLLQNSE